MITSVSWNPRGQAKALPIVAEAKIEEQEASEVVAAPSVSRGGMDEDDIVAKYGLENYDDEPGSYECCKERNCCFLVWFEFSRLYLNSNMSD